LGNIEDFINAGGRKMELWIKENNYKVVDFSDPKAFININNLSELAKIEKENN
jgi:molybdopterin-guanine dinucleotide biosynthesis protein A